MIERSKTLTFNPAEREFFETKACPIPSLLARDINRAQRLQGQAWPDQEHLPPGAGKVRPGWWPQILVRG